MIEFVPAARSNTAIVLALAGASGSGKTKSALELAVGLADGKGPIAMIDSEGRRGLHYADEYKFLHTEWRPPFTPESLGQTLREAERRMFAVVIVDSASDEFEGEGGLQEMADAEFEEQVKKGWEPNRASAWALPKARHKRHVVRWLRNAQCHVIFCCRASEKVKFEKVIRNGRQTTAVVPIGWTPICEKNFLYEVTTSLLFTPDQPGVPKPIKLYDKHAPFFPPGQQVSRAAGKALAEWAAGGLTPTNSTGKAEIPPSRPLGETDDDRLRDELNAAAEKVAARGSKTFNVWWQEDLTPRERSLIRGFRARYQGIAHEADAMAEQQNA